MGKVTRVWNDTEAVIHLKQGSANVFHVLHSLPKGKTYNIKVDESATYREYWCAVQPVQPDVTTAAERVVFTSDDCAEFSKVKIYKDKNDRYVWKGIEKRHTLWNKPVQPAEDSTLVSTTPGTPQDSTAPGAPRDSTTPGAPQVSNPVPPKAPNPVQDAKPPTFWNQITGVFRKKN